MKTKALLLLTGIFTLAAATAQPMTDNEIFSAIDGEYDHVADGMLRLDATQRVNFAISGQHSNLLDNVLSGIDSEYDNSSREGMRVNYSMSSLQAGESNVVLDEVLSGVDAEYSF
jgi:hypothetical protein